MNESVRAEHAHLREAATHGTLAALCDRQDLDLVVVFGSVLDPDTDPRDLDVAVRFGPGGGAQDTLRLLNDLYELTGSERIDLMVLNRAAPLARERALIPVGARPCQDLGDLKFGLSSVAARTSR